MRKLTVLTALLLLLPAVSQAKTLEDLLVEKGVITKSEARASNHDGSAKVYWNKGTRLDFADTGFTANIGTQFRTRYQFVDNDSGTPNRSSFEVNTARLVVSGTALHKEFDYKLQTDFAGGGASLKDAYLTWHTCDNSMVRMGQFKPAISRQNWTSVSKLQFADRSVVSDFFAIDRNQGVDAAYMVTDDVLVAAQLFNGVSNYLGTDPTPVEGINGVGADTKHTGAVAIRANLMGSMDPLSEGDVEHTEDTAVNAGFAFAYSEAENVALTNWDVVTLSADLNVKSQGFSLHGEFFYQDHDPQGAGAGSSIEGTGFYVQAGYFVEPKTWEVAAGYGYVDCDNGMAIANNVAATNYCTGFDNLNEVDATINYYWWKHHLKAQIGFAHLTQGGLGAGASDVDTNRWILSLSSWF